MLFVPVLVLLELPPKPPKPVFVPAVAVDAPKRPPPPDELAPKAGWFELKAPPVVPDPNPIGCSQSACARSNLSSPPSMAPRQGKVIESKRRKRAYVHSKQKEYHNCSDKGDGRSRNSSGSESRTCRSQNPSCREELTRSKMQRALTSDMDEEELMCVFLIYLPPDPKAGVVCWLLPLPNSVEPDDAPKPVLLLDPKPAFDRFH